MSIEWYEKYGIKPSDYKNLMPRYVKNDIVYPSVIRRNFFISREKAMAFLEKLREMGMVERFYVIRCPVCGFLMQKKYRNEKDIPFEAGCESCGNDIKNPEQYKEVIYQIIQEE